MNSSPIASELCSKAIAIGVILLAGCHDPTTEPNPVAIQTAVAAEVDSAGRYIIVLRDGVADADGRARALADQYSYGTRHYYSYLFKGFAGDLPANAAAALRNLPEVARVVPDRVATADITDLNAGWGLGRIDQRFGPSNNQFTYTTNGTGVNIYILGNGVFASHPDFGGRVSGFWTYNPSYPSTQPCNNHETAIASIAAGAEFGVAKNANIRAVRFNDCDMTAWTGSMVAALDHVAAYHVKPAIAIMSWGLPAWLDGVLPGSVHHAARGVTNSGVFLVVTAGNNGSNACDQSPGNAPELMTVGATNASDQRASFSNYGSCVDIFAPGQSVDAANYTLSPGPFTVVSGTSFAAPYVAGAGALLYQQYPTDTQFQIHYAIIDGGTSGVVQNAGPSSPNLLLYSNLPVPVYVSIQGPSLVGPYMNCAWHAIAKGGRAPFGYTWYGVLSGNQNSVSGSVPSPGFLNVDVTDAIGGYAATSKYINVDPNNFQIFCS